MSEMMDFESMTAYDKLRKIYLSVSVRTNGEKEIWGRINDGVLYLSSYGKIVNQCVPMLNEIHDAIYVENYIVMPNHVHLLISIKKDGFEYPPTDEELNDFITDIVESFKKKSSSEIGRLLSEGQKLGIPRDLTKEFWHKSCHIRGVHSLYDYKKAVAHIRNNVEEWTSDRYYRLNV